MRRREFIGLIGVAACPLMARAQSKMPLIGFLSGRSRAETTVVMGQFYKALDEAGFVEGQNLRVEYRWAEGQYERLATLAAELVDSRPTPCSGRPGVTSRRSPPRQQHLPFPSYSRQEVIR